MQPIDLSNGDWRDTSLGEIAFTEENIVLERAVRRMHGDTLLWSGINPNTAQLSKRCMVRQRLYLAESSDHRVSGTTPNAVEGSGCFDEMSSFYASLEEIPLENCSIDAAVLHHSLERCADPRTALREVARVLQPGGQLLICGFNRYSSWSLCRLARSTPDHYLSPRRVGDWLEVLGFERLEPTSYLLFRPPLMLANFDGPSWDGLRSWARQRALPIGSVFVLHLRKKSLSMRPDRLLRDLRARAAAGTGYPKFARQQQLLAARREPGIENP